MEDDMLVEDDILEDDKEVEVLVDVTGEGLVPGPDGVSSTCKENGDLCFLFEDFMRRILV